MRLSPQAEFLRTGRQSQAPRPDIRRRQSPIASADVSAADSTATSRRLWDHAHSLASSQCWEPTSAYTPFPEAPVQNGNSACPLGHLLGEATSVGCGLKSDYRYSK